jgi:hypothetical protein
MISFYLLLLFKALVVKIQYAGLTVRNASLSQGTSLKIAEVFVSPANLLKKRTLVVEAGLVSICGF